MQAQHPYWFEVASAGQPEHHTHEDISILAICMSAAIEIRMKDQTDQEKKLEV